MPTIDLMLTSRKIHPWQLAGAGRRRLCPILLGAALVLPGAVRGAEAAAAKPDNPPSARMLAKALEFRKQAQGGTEAAFVRYVGNSDKARKLFGFLGKTLCPHTDPAKGWGYFFETSIWSLGFPTRTTAVAVFYHPWSDVALVTEWIRHDTGTTLDDADLIMGDALRNLSKPPFEIEPHWLRGPLPAHLAAGISSARTVRGFERIFSPSNKPFKGGWRAAMQLGDAGLLESNHTGVGTMFEGALAGLTRYQEDAAMAPVRNQTRETLEQIRSGSWDKVYQVAAGTPAQVRTILKEHAEPWGNAKVITCVSKRDEQKKEHTFVVLSMPRLPEWFMSFWFRPGANPTLPPTLARIDLIDQNQSYKYLGSIEKMNVAPERGELTRATIEAGDWLGRLITIGEAAMQGVVQSAAAGPVGSLLGGCCDELIGSTSWDLDGTPRNNPARPAREQLQVPSKPPIAAGAVRSGSEGLPPRSPQGAQPGGRPPGGGVVPSGGSGPVPGGGHHGTPPVWHPPVGSGGGGSGLPPAGSSCPGG